MIILQLLLIIRYVRIEIATLLKQKLERIAMYKCNCDVRKIIKFDRTPPTRQPCGYGQFSFHCPFGERINSVPL